MGFIFNGDSLQPGPRKIHAIEHFLAPTKCPRRPKVFRSHKFFRRFAPRYAHIATPLCELTNKNEEFGEQNKEAFSELKSHLVKSPILVHYNPDLETEVHYDTSFTGLAGMLLQSGSDKNWKIVYCVSKKTTDTVRKYHFSKLELMGIV